MEIKITLVKSLIACKKDQIATANSFGFKRPGDSVVVKDNAAVQGKIRKISHLVKVETV